MSTITVSEKSLCFSFPLNKGQKNWMIVAGLVGEAIAATLVVVASLQLLGPMGSIGASLAQIGGGVLLLASLAVFTLALAHKKKVIDTPACLLDAPDAAKQAYALSMDRIEDVLPNFSFVENYAVGGRKNIQEPKNQDITRLATVLYPHLTLAISGNFFSEDLSQNLPLAKELAEISFTACMLMIEELKQQSKDENKAIVNLLTDQSCYYYKAFFWPLAVYYDLRGRVDESAIVDVKILYETYRDAMLTVAPELQTIRDQRYNHWLQGIFMTPGSRNKYPDTWPT